MTLGKDNTVIPPQPRNVRFCITKPVIFSKLKTPEPLHSTLLEDSGGRPYGPGMKLSFPIRVRSVIFPICTVPLANEWFPGRKIMVVLEVK